MKRRLASACVVKALFGESRCPAPWKNNEKAQWQAAAFHWASLCGDGPQAVPVFCAFTLRQPLSVGASSASSAAVSAGASSAFSAGCFLRLGRLGRDIVGVGGGAGGKGLMPLLVRVHGDDLHLDLVADFEHRRGVGNHFVRNLRVVDQSVHAGHNLGKRAERHQRHDGDGDDVARRCRS